MSIQIVNPGLLTTIQDKGRFGFQQQGVIVSGAMDSFALRAANVLVGNEENAAALEVTLMGTSIRFEADSLISICGGNLSPVIEGEPVPLWRPLLIKEGATLEFGACRSGARAYVAVAGGIDVPLVMHSRSTYLRAGIGGHEGRALKAGDRLGFGPPSESAEGYLKARQAASALRAGRWLAAEWFVGSESLPAYAKDPVIRVIRGREYDSFTEESQTAFVTRPFRITPQSDRMGYRLQGETLALKESLETLSEAVSFGTVQVPPEGNPIVLMADRQTIGGYPRIAQVITTDLPVLAQAKPGDSIRFAEVSLQEAQELHIRRELEFERLTRAIKLYLKAR
ncbi:biotin-dependent carboxyltransferase family protein [Paenibacillus ehimensis]|uniref:Biotin-dependent carboxyltransferase family protein n=1 Tax=Paenibacillus ehimensis TaxID=79264 RepID=A0ABT8VEY6_9BACL|nr:biotin-dependent carboxyltransferase family protein [Paenibacillus ehimensis]MDO3679538.1 biotin-dependent carboxyltransferase family protein [Paenibacillus ehimensis]